MGKSGGRGHQAYVPPVKNVNVGVKDTRKRLIIIAVLLVVGFTAIGVGIYQSGKWEDGWKIVESDNVLGCASEISFHYYLGGEGAEERSKAVAKLYTELCAREDAAYGVAEGAAEGSLRTLNINPNESVEVCPELYRTVVKLKDLDNRLIYLGPIYETYEGLFSCTEDWQTADFDPWQNEDLKAEFARVAEYAADPAMVDIEVLGENRLRLNVDPEYEAFAAERALTRYVDLHYLTNAAILDDMASALREAGYTEGYLQSAEGYGVNLTSGGEFTLNVANGSDGIVAQIAEEPPMCFAAFRDYALTDIDKWRCYTFEDGSTRSVYIDPEDGLPKSCLSDLLLVSKKQSCLELALYGGSLLAAGEFQPEKLPAEGLSALWCEEKTLKISGDEVSVTEIAEEYSKEYFNA